MPQPSYCVGIDLGGTCTTAAVLRDGEPGPETLPLGERTVAVASTVHVAPDGSMLCGEAASRRAVSDPERVVLDFVRRIGDGTPLPVAGGTAADVAARFVGWVLKCVALREGGPATRIALTHPAGWGAHERTALASALAAQGLSDVLLLSEPAAAAVAHARTERVDAGGAVAVYHLGGGTFDAAVVRRLPGGGFGPVGEPVRIERLGGGNFDELVLGHVRTAIGDAWDRLDAADPAVRSAVARLRGQCTAAKEALSANSEVTIPVALPGWHRQVRLGRDEFEALIEPAVAETVRALRRALDAAGTPAAALCAVLLVGGSSRIPLVTRLVTAELGRSVLVDADVGSAVAAGAALAAGGRPEAQAVPVGSLLPPADAASAGPTSGLSLLKQAAPHRAPTPTPAAAAAGVGERIVTSSRGWLSRNRVEAAVAGLGLAASLATGLPLVLVGSNSGAGSSQAAGVGSIDGRTGSTFGAEQPLVAGWPGGEPAANTVDDPRQPILLAAVNRPRTGPTAAAAAPAAAARSTAAAPVPTTAAVVPTTVPAVRPTTTPPVRPPQTGPPETTAGGRMPVRVTTSPRSRSSTTSTTPASTTSASTTSVEPTDPTTVASTSPTMTEPTVSPPPSPPGETTDHATDEPDPGSGTGLGAG